MSRTTTCFVFFHNQVDYVASRLESVIKQTLIPDEIRIIDDGSSDGTKPEIIRCISGYDDIIKSKISFYSYNEATGKASGRWQHLLNAKTDLIWLVEGDDCNYLSFLEKMSSKFESENNLVLTWCWSDFIDSKNKLLGQDPDFLTSKPDNGEDISFIKKHGIHIGSEIVRNNLIYFNPFPNLGANLFLTSALQSVIKMNWKEISTLKIAADWLIYSEILRMGNLYILTEPLNMFRRHSNAHSIKSNSLEHLSEFDFMQSRTILLSESLHVSRVQNQIKWRNHVAGNLSIPLNVEEGV